MDVTDCLKQPVIGLVLGIIISIAVNIISDFLQTFLYERSDPGEGYIDYGNKEEVLRHTYVLSRYHKGLRLYWNRFGMSFPIPNEFSVTDINYSSAQDSESIPP
jgi:hypothetical protein